MSLDSDIEKFIAVCDKRMVAVARQSIQETVQEMQKPTAKGGRMRVDTGFLRSTGAASLENFPSGPTDKPDDALPGSITSDDTQLNTVLAKMKMGDTFFFGWTATYAQVRETYDGFMETQLQNWRKTVARNVQKVRRKVQR